MDYRPHYPAPLRWLSHAVDACLALGGICILLLVFSNAALRGAAGFDLAWSLEVTAFLLLWTTFLGCSAAVARGAHMRVTELAEAFLSARMHSGLSVLIDLAITVLMCSLIYWGVQISIHTWAQKTTVLYWPVGLLYASMPAGIALSLIFHGFNMFCDLTGKGRLQAVHSDGGEEVQ